MPCDRADRLAHRYALVALVLACLYVANAYVTNHDSYLDLDHYAHGLERQPFQSRDLMRWPLLLAEQSPALGSLAAGHRIPHAPAMLVVQLTAFFGLLLAGWVATLLYRLLAPHGCLPLLPFAILVVLCLFNFVQTVPFLFPYDLPAMAFLGWGIYLVFTRRFAWLLPLFTVATFNRETTLFLVLLLPLTAFAQDRHLSRRTLFQTAALGTLWIGVLLLQYHRYANNPTEVGPRILDNLQKLARPLLWPNIFSASAFLLPWIFLLRHRLPDPRIRAAMLLLPLWVLLLLSLGQILELRIYGDISVLVAVAAAILLEQTALGYPSATQT